jgi:hypothetical protein
MRIAIITGPRDILDADELLIRKVVRELCARGYTIYMGDAVGVDSIALSECLLHSWDCYRIFSPLASLGRSRNGLAERSTRMVKTALRDANGAEIICVGFLNMPCPMNIVPSRSWISGTPSSGTWSTIALSIGLGIKTWVFTFIDFRMKGFFLPAWFYPLPTFVGSGDTMPLGARYECLPKRPTSFLFPDFAHEALRNGWTDLANDALFEYGVTDDSEEGEPSES